MGSVTQSIASVAALLLSVAILLAGNGLQGTLLLVRADLEAFSRVEIGILGSFYFIGFTLGCLVGPALIARAAHIRAYLALVSIASSVALLHALIVEPVLWWFLRALTHMAASTRARHARNPLPNRSCPHIALSGHLRRLAKCPLSGVKRTSVI